MSHILHTPIIYSLVRHPLDKGGTLAQVLKDISGNGQIFICSVSHGNILGEIENLDDVHLKSEAHKNYGQLLAHMGSARVLSFDEPVSRVWGEIRGLVRPGQHGASAEALMVAATAQAYGFRMVTAPEEWHERLPDVIFQHV